MDEMLKGRLSELFAGYPEIKLVYLFGSRARGDAGTLGDYDFGIYFDGADAIAMFDIKLELMAKIAAIFQSDEIDIAVINLSEMPEFKFNMISEGELIYEIEPYRVLVEPRILNEYFDFHMMLKNHGLTKA